MRSTLLGLTIAALLSGACSIRDADLDASPALRSIALSATEDELDRRLTRITGTLEVGYTSTELVQLRVLDNGTPIHSESLPADALTLELDLLVELLDDGVNELVVEASYNGQSIQQKLLLSVPDPLQGFTLVPAATTVNVFSVELSGTLQLGYHASEHPSLEILVNGQTMHDESLDASGLLAVPFEVTVPLTREGPNEIVGIVRYRGQELSQQLSVVQAWDAPTLTFPSWSSNYVAHVGLDLSGDVVVTAAPDYAVTRVDFAIDGGAWWPALDHGDGSYGVQIIDPDIGNSIVTVRVVTANNGNEQTTLFHDAFTVEPIFDCNTPSLSMLPDNDLISDQNQENRAMVGYFGDPDGGHLVSFVISAVVPNDGPYDVVGAVTTYGTTALGVQYDVSRLRCNNDPCFDLSYDLSVYVDGAFLCQHSSFGYVVNY